MFISVLWIYRIGSWNVGKTIILDNHYFKFSNRSTCFVFQVNECLCKNVFPNSNFEGVVSMYVFGKWFWHYRELKCECWTSRHILCEKILINFICGEVWILVEKWKIHDAYIFPRSLLQTWRLETIPLCLKTGTCKNTSKFTLF